MITQTIHQLPIFKDSILKNELSTRCSKYMSIPIFSYGFHYFINQNKSKLKILDSDNFKTKTYQNILNPYELVIPDYDKSIGNVSEKYFNLIGDIPKINSIDFYKIWEILIMFNIDGKKNMTINDNGECLRSLLLFRDKFENDKNDKFYILDNNDINNDIIKYYDNEKKGKINTIKKPETGIDLVIANGQIQPKNKNTIEQESYKLLLEEINIAINSNSKGGNFICKFFEFYTMISIKLLCILQELYDTVFVVKPLMSKIHESELYVVCLNFKGHKNSNKIESLIKEFNKCESNNTFINDIYIDFNIPLATEKYITSMNLQIGNQQYLRISNIMTYIDSGNYYGDLYHAYRQKQIDSHDKWLPLFFPLTSKDISVNEEVIDKEMKKQLEDNRKKSEVYLE